MPKKIINDIVLSPKSIRKIPLTKEKDKDYYKLKKEIIHPSSGLDRKPLNPKFILWLIAGLCVLALLFGISILFSKATVIVTAKTETIDFNNEAYTVKLNSNNISEISYEILSLKQSASEVVSATEEKDVNQKASGKIVIYNNHSSAPQRLINNTRFEASNGNIYRINSSVIVPGIKKVDGQNVPGSVEAVVYADEPGDKYNMRVSDLTGDFKIPGFKGDVRYNSFYARLKEDIAGGFSGKQRVVAPELQNSTVESLKIKLKEQLIKELYAIKPENFIIFEGGYNIEYRPLSDTPVDTDKVQINLEGKLNSLVFNNSKLANYFAVKKVKDFDSLPVEFIPGNGFDITFTEISNIDISKKESMQIEINGQAIIKWIYDDELLKKDLAGKKESDIKNVLYKYKDTIKSMQVVFRPIWTRYFPDDLNKIKVQE
jgi:hypothetical protein